MSKYLLAGLLAVAGSAHAADNGFYLGAGISQAKIDDAFGESSLDLDDTAWKLIAGFRPLDRLAVEVDYMDLGSEIVNFGSVTVAAAEARALAAYAVAFLPVPMFDIYAKAGLARWELEGAVPGVGIPEDPQPLFAFDESGTEFAWGLGAQARFGSLAARLEFESFDIDDTDGLELFSLGLTWTFF